MMAWYNSPLWAWRLDDELEELKSSSSSSRADDQRQDKEIERLKTRVTELENQLLALEKILADQGLLPPAPEPSEMKEPPQAPAGRPRRLSSPDRGGHRLPPLRPASEGQPGQLLRLRAAFSIRK